MRWVFLMVLCLFANFARGGTSSDQPDVPVVQPVPAPEADPHAKRPEPFILRSPFAKPGEKLPVVLLLHGYGGNGFFINTYFGLTAHALARPFILVVPEGLKNKEGYRYWNASRACCDFDHHGGNDTAYLIGLINDLKKTDAVDESRIYVVGHSNGGFMAYRLACEPGNPFAAVVSFAGAMPPEAVDCPSSRPVAVLHIHALDDETIQYYGNDGSVGLQAYAGARESVKMWAEKDRCAKDATTGPRLKLVRGVPGFDTTTEIWRNCEGGAKVELWTIREHPVRTDFAAHTPWLSAHFADRVLDFLLGQKRVESPREPTKPRSSLRGARAPSRARGDPTSVSDPREPAR